jgi:hypothetical protein
MSDLRDYWQGTSPLRRERQTEGGTDMILTEWQIELLRVIGDLLPSKRVKTARLLNEVQELVDLGYIATISTPNCSDLSYAVTDKGRWAIDGDERLEPAPLQAKT